MTTIGAVGVRENPIKVFVAETLEEKMEVYRFRYKVYIEEMSLQLVTANYKKRIVSDELDKKGILLYAKAGNEIIGTQRINIGKIDNFPNDLAELLSLNRFQNYYKHRNHGRFAYTSKLMVANQYRNSPVLHLLTAKGYDLYCSHQVPFNFGVCNFHLLRLYEQFGCRRYGSSFVAPGYDGVLMPFVLLVDDILHLRAVRSPFYRIARKRESPASKVTDWFYAEFQDCLDIVNSQLISEDNLWQLLSNRLGNFPDQVMPVLYGLNPLEAKRFLYDCGLIMKFRSGEQITIANASSHTLKILIAGRLYSSIKCGVFDEAVKPGQCFGTSGLVEPSKYEQDIFAATDAEVLLLSGLSFERFRIVHPDAANKIVSNITIC